MIHVGAFLLNINECRGIFCTIVETFLVCGPAAYTN